MIAYDRFTLLCDQWELKTFGNISL